ncbi:hypothetical protein F5Y16DRAFT_411127 [Xylariaceae sp. FL0255]|nr:hypothetical protein F5Y16DRAFT_411127 [Xylariaceae sp. FL0255]
MLLLFFLSFSLIWTSVLTIYIFREWKLFLKVLRWATSVWLVIFGIAVSEVLREGLTVNGEASLHRDVRLAWTSWFLLVACSVLDWRFVLPAAALPLWFLSYPEVRTLLDYGLVRLQWIGFVHNPLAWAIKRRETLQIGIYGHHLFGGVFGQMIGWGLTPLRGLLDYAAGFVIQTTEEGLGRLRPPTRWSWSQYTGQW